MITINPFVIIVDKEGNVADTCGLIPTDQIFQIIRYMDKKDPDNSPHTAFEYCNNTFKIVTDKIHEDLPYQRHSRRVSNIK